MKKATDYKIGDKIRLTGDVDIVTVKKICKGNKVLVHSHITIGGNYPKGILFTLDCNDKRIITEQKPPDNTL